jgi:GTP-binding protein
MLEIKKAVYQTSYVTNEQLPTQGLTEVAFIGRSNVGKSSLINAVTRTKNLAKTSSTPGKTQTINHFLINNGFYFVDLPGYGYAKVSQKQRNKWQDMIHLYLSKRAELKLLFVLIDARVKPQLIDLEFLAYCFNLSFNVQIVFTKCDKTNQQQRSFLFKEFKKLLPIEQMQNHVPIYSSAAATQGISEILSKIDTVFA